MLTKSLTASLVVLGIASSSAVLADHNSVWGEGWANMPNDIHNTRVDTLGDNTAFRDFVRQGNGADSVNRYVDTSATQRGNLNRQLSGATTQRGRK